jgi:L,D-transpeptidase ErfK/SrfK
MHREFMSPVAGLARALALITLVTLAGCSVFRPAPEPVPVEPAKPRLAAPLATHTFRFDPQATGVLGELQVTYARYEDTLPDIARRFNLGFDELVNANPGVDPWLPGEGTRIVLPTQFVLPDAPYEGVVVNLAALRMFYYPQPGKDGQRVVITYPIGIGKVGWATPEGTTKIVSKRKDPYWTPPASVRKEHAAEGDPLPARVPPGPENPLGNRAMNLGWSSYLIHGTNKPAGVGLRASHGCIRMYPEDVLVLFDMVAVGTKVTVVNQPILYRMQGDSLYVQSYPPHEELLEAKSRKKGPKSPPVHTHLDDALAAKMRKRAEPYGGAFDRTVTDQVVSDARGVAVPVSRPGITYDAFVAAARQVENTLPAGANWDGRDDAQTESASQTGTTPDGGGAGRQ